MYREMYRELCFYIKNINSNLDLFPDRYNLIKKAKVFLKAILKNL